MTRTPVNPHSQALNDRLDAIVHRMVELKLFTQEEAEAKGMFYMPLSKKRLESEGEVCNSGPKPATPPE